MTLRSIIRLVIATMRLQTSVMVDGILTHDGDVSETSSIDGGEVLWS